MSGDTLGNCPVCGHIEASYDDWTFQGYRFGEDGPERIFRCTACGAQVTPDKPGRGLVVIPHY